MQKILIVDDDNELRTMLRTVLKLKGYEVLEADNGNTAVEIARSRQPDLIISDIEMPGADGLQELSELRNNPATAHISLILMTGKQHAKQREGMDLGADDFLSKPFQISTLLKSVEARLKKQSVWQKVAEKEIAALRSEITTNLPHEFSAPMSEVLVYSEVMENCADELDANKIREMARTIRENATHLERAIKNFVLFSRLETIGPDSDELFAMRSQLTEDVTAIIAHSVREQMESTNRKADLQLNLEAGRAEIGPELLTKIIEELVDNAIKVSAAGTPITVGNREIGNFVEITISDQGPGLTAEQIDKVSPFVRFDSANKSFHGLGLGLAISRKLTELHGGRFEIKSEPEQGTTVTVQLPAHLQQFHSSPPPPGDPELK